MAVRDFMGKVLSVFNMDDGYDELDDELVDEYEYDDEEYDEDDDFEDYRARTSISRGNVKKNDNRLRQRMTSKIRDINYDSSSYGDDFSKKNISYKDEDGAKSKLSTPYNPYFNNRVFYTSMYSKDDCRKANESYLSGYVVIVDLKGCTDAELILTYLTGLADGTKGDVGMFGETVILSPPGTQIQTSEDMKF